MAAPSRFEDQVKWRFTRCLNDIVIKGLAATAFSILGTKMFLKNRVSTKRATMAGFGIAIGMSYQNCEREMQLALTTPCDKTRKKKVKGEDDCLDLEEGDKKAENMSSDKKDKGKPPEELENDKKKKPVDLKNEKAKKTEEPKKQEAASKDVKAKKAEESKKNKNTKADEDKAQTPVDLKNTREDKSEVAKSDKM